MSEFKCEDCLGMAQSYGCYCDVMGAAKAGGPASTSDAMERAQHLRECGWKLEEAAKRLEQEAYDRAIERGEHSGVDGI